MIVERWGAAEVRALRTAALRDTQEQFAARLGWGVPTIRKWERVADGRCVRANRAEDLDTVLSALTGEQLQRFAAALTQHRPARPMHPGTTAGHHPAGTEEDAAVRRRDFGKFAALAAASLPSRDRAPSATRLGAEDVDRLTAAVDELEAADQRVGGAALVDAAVATLNRTLDLLGTSSYDEATGRAFMTATGNLAVQTGWLAFDAEQHRQARRCYADALSLASACDDPDLTAYACLCAALQAVWLSRDGRGSLSYALTLIGRARTLMRGRPPGRIHVLIAAREAGVRALLGDADGFGRATATAWREMDAAWNFEPIDECAQWLRFVTHSEIRSHEARAHNDIGNPAQALALYEVACSEPAQPRNSVNARAWLAATRAAIGDTGGALEEAAPVLAALEVSVASTRTAKVLTPVRAVARALPSGEEFAARFDALTTTGSTA
ncbi:hypothetical protein AB0H71_15830 [Nocardia sp. NPDC050697]|uniref:helix-turn-helix domain-containing protein n=1 Tax=Nocardia sp. NPDC050697 TaxID=3155158 RepID=UPI0033E415C8